MSSAAIDTTFGQASMDAVDALDPLFTNMESDVADRVSGALYAGLLNGTNPADLAGQLVDCLSPSRATTIARTEMLGAYRTSALDAYRANSDVVGQWMWSSARGGACIACLEMDGEVFSLDEEMDGMTHPNCFPAGVLVSGPRALGSTTRWYEGEIVEIETACGYILTVTPNHPILTTRGWVAAGLLHKGGNVISRIWSDGRGATDITSPQDYQVEAPIEQVAVTLGSSGPMTPIRVPTAPEDFHGDGLGSQVHVVRANGFLRHHLYAAVAQPRLKQYLRRRNAEPAFLARLGALLTAFDRVAPATAGNMGRFTVAAMFVGSPLLRHQSVSLSVPAHGNAPLAEAARDDRPRYPVPSSKSLQRFARFVAPDRIVRVERRPFAGHVYNLQTREGWYIANNIIAHNCRCSPIPITSSWADILGPLGIDASDIEDTSILDDYETGAEWFAKQDAATQIDALGSKAAYEAVQAGEVVPRDFVGVAHDEQYGDTIYTKSLKEALTPTFNPAAVEQYQQGLTELDQLLADLRAPRISEAAQELKDAQAALQQAVQSGASRDDIKAAQWDVANKQAAVDLENGGRGAKIVIRGADPLDTTQFDQTMQDLFGRNLSRDEIGGLVGAPEGSFVEVYPSDDGMAIVTHGPDWDPMAPNKAEWNSIRYISRDPATGDLVASNTSFEVRADVRGQGLGARIFADQVDTLSKLDVRYIETEAVGSASDPARNGYYTWPRFGYDGPLPPESIRLIRDAIQSGDLPQDWADFRQISDVMEAPGGQDWWKANGTKVHVRFDLTDGSYSRRTLENYLKQRGIQ